MPSSDRAPEDRLGRPWSARTRTWVLSCLALLASAGLLLSLPDGGPLLDAPSWMAIAVLLGFVASEPLVFHVEARNEAMSFSPSDIPLALGLLLLPPAVLVAVRLVGTAVALQVWRRQPPFKLCLNLGAFALEAMVAVVVLRTLLGVLGTEGPVLWVALVIALLSGLLAAGVVIAAAISFFEGQWLKRTRREFSHAYLFYVPGAVLGATTVVPYDTAPWLVVVYLVPTAVVWTLLRSFGALRHRHRDLTRIHAFSSRVGRSARIDDIGGVAASEIAELMRAASVALVVFGAQARVLETWLGDRRWLDAMPVTADDPAWAAVMTPGEPVAVAGSRDRQLPDPTGLLDHLSSPSSNALVMALGDETSVLGVLVVAGREGVSSSFDAADSARLRSLGQQLTVALRKGLLHDRIRHEALHDPLTGVPNRSYFDAWSQQHLESPSRPATFLMMDLDRFKEVNDTLGHQAGDTLLVEVCERLVEAGGPTAMVSRLGGDEFAVALPDTAEARALEVVERISELVEQPVDLDGTRVSIGASIGIAIAPEDGTDVSTLMRRADLAMYDAKHRHDRYTRYSPELESVGAERLGLLGDLRAALAAGELHVHFQPKIALSDRRVIGVEALARWDHPTEGDLRPDVFVPLAEQAGLIDGLTDLVLRESLAAARSWSDSGQPLVVAVNVSAQSLIVEEFPATVASALDDAGVPAELLVLEITERAMIGDSPRTRAILAELDRLGVRLSVDDFGTGYSSLVTLRSMPISELKIDRRFVRGLAESGSDRIIVDSTIQLAHNLGMTVVAEGVESEVIADQLRDAGCDVGQGFGLCPPMGKQDLDEFLATRRARALGGVERR